MTDMYGLGRRPFGHARDGTPVEAITLTHAKGTSATILTLGATLQALVMPDRDGRLADVVLGHDAAEPYWRHPAYLGATVGPYANRIARGRFSLDGVEHALACNDGPNHLHGADAGLDQKVWMIDAAEGGATPSLTLSTISPDGEGGYPGTVGITTVWTLDEDGLSIAYRATTTAPTIVNLTNHAYFNLAGFDSGRSAHEQVLTVFADGYTPVDATLIPTGEIAPVAGTPFDFRRPTRIGDRAADAYPQLRLGQGYDHNMVLNGNGDLVHAARLADPISGRRLDLLTDAPGLQVYDGHYLRDDAAGKGGVRHAPFDAICLEAQSFPDAPNQPHFQTTRLDPGQTWRRRIVFRLSTDTTPD